MNGVDKYDLFFIYKMGLVFLFLHLNSMKRLCVLYVERGRIVWYHIISQRETGNATLKMKLNGCKMRKKFTFLC